MDDISQLAGLILPEQVSWWPLAIGWWWLLSAIVICAGFVAMRRWHRWQQSSYRREAVAQVEQLSQQQAAQLPAILGRVYHVSLHHVCAAKWPKSVLEYLQQQDALPPEQTSLLQRIAFQAPERWSMTAESFEQLKLATVAWIKEHRIEPI